MALPAPLPVRPGTRPVRVLVVDMTKVAIDAGAVDTVLPIDLIGGKILELADEASRVS